MEVMRTTCGSWFCFSTICARTLAAKLGDRSIYQRIVLPTLLCVLLSYCKYKDDITYQENGKIDLTRE